VSRFVGSVLKAFPTYLTDEWFEVAVHVHVTLEDNLVLESFSAE